MTELELTTEDVVRGSLNAIADLRKELNDLDDRKKQGVALILTSELQAELDALDLEFKPEYERIQGLIADSETLTKVGVIEIGKTVKGNFLMAVFNKGRVRWDSKALDGYSKSHPELLEFRKEGNPYASIRGI